MVLTDSGMTILDKLEHPSNAFWPIDLISEIIIILINEEQFLKELFGIAWISPKISRFLIPSKAFSPIFLTELGRVIFVIELHLLNEFDSIDITEDGITISVSAKHPAKVYSSITLTGGIFISFKEEQSQNAYDLIILTESGMIILCSFEHPLKVDDSINVTDGGIIISLNLFHFLIDD